MAKVEIMTRGDILDQLNQEGLDVSGGRLAYVIRNGFVSTPTRNANGRMEFNKKNLTELKNYFKKNPKRQINSTESSES